jgi:hypothetical protein
MRRLPTIFEAASPASTARDLVASDRIGREYEQQLVALAATSDQACSKGDWRGVAAVQARAEVLLAEAASWQQRHEALLRTRRAGCRRGCWRTGYARRRSVRG